MQLSWTNEKPMNIPRQPTKEQSLVEYSTHHEILHTTLDSCAILHYTALLDPERVLFNILYSTLYTTFSC